MTVSSNPYPLFVQAAASYRREVNLNPHLEHPLHSVWKAPLHFVVMNTLAAGGVAEMTTRIALSVILLIPFIVAVTVDSNSSFVHFYERQVSIINIFSFITSTALNVAKLSFFSLRYFFSDYEVSYAPFNSVTSSWNELKSLLPQDTASYSPLLHDKGIPSPSSRTIHPETLDEIDTMLLNGQKMVQSIPNYPNFALVTADLRPLLPKIFCLPLTQIKKFLIPLYPSLLTRPVPSPLGTESTATLSFQESMVFTAIAMNREDILQYLFNLPGFFQDPCQQLAQAILSGNAQKITTLISSRDPSHQQLLQSPMIGALAVYKNNETMLNAILERNNYSAFGHLFLASLETRNPDLSQRIWERISRHRDNVSLVGTSSQLRTRCMKAFVHSIETYTEIPEGLRQIAQSLNLGRNWEGGDFQHLIPLTPYPFEIRDPLLNLLGRNIFSQAQINDLLAYAARQDQFEFCVTLIAEYGAQPTSANFIWSRGLAVAILSRIQREPDYHREALQAVAQLIPANIIYHLVQERGIFRIDLHVFNAPKIQELLEFCAHENNLRLCFTLIEDYRADPLLIPTTPTAINPRLFSPLELYLSRHDVNQQALEGLLFSRMRKVTETQMSRLSYLATSRFEDLGVVPGRAVRFHDEPNYRILNALVALHIILGSGIPKTMFFRDQGVAWPHTRWLTPSAEDYIPVARRLADLPVDAEREFIAAEHIDTARDQRLAITAPRLQAALEYSFSLLANSAWKRRLAAVASPDMLFEAGG